MENGSSYSGGVRNSIGIKLIIIGFLIAVLMIPVSMIGGVISERQSRRAEVVDEISAKWGNEQTLVGPVLRIPYRYYQSEGKKRHSFTGHAFFLPDKLEISGDVNPEIRYRGIYQTVLYNARVTIKASFAKPTFAGLGVAEKDILI